MNRRRFLRLAGLAAGAGTLAVTGVAGNWYAGRRADERRLAEALAKLDATDPDWDVVGVVKAHNAAIPADAENATVVGLDALARCAPSWQARQRAIYSPGGTPDLVWDDDRLPHDEEFCSLYEVYLETREAQRDALTTRRFPAGGLPLHFAEPNPFGTLFPNTLKVREVATVLKDYATVEAYLGHGDEALRAADAGLHFAQVTLTTEPTLIAQLVRIASLSIAVGGVQQTLAWAEPVHGLTELQRALADAAAADGICPALRGERAGVMSIYDSVRNGALPDDVLDDFVTQSATPTWTTPIERRFRRRNLVRDQAASLDVLNGLLVAAKLAGPARLQSAKAMSAGVSPEAGKLLASITLCVVADDRCKSRLLCASVGLGCERYRRQFGHFPTSLADIPTSILSSIPNDPFSGQPLSYQLLADGAVVYSVGPDGGVVEPTDTGSLLTRQLNFRLWNPDARRRPPTPRPEPVPDPDDLLDKLGEP